MKKVERPTVRGIKDVFYETRVLIGRDCTVKRFANEILAGEVDPVMLSYIEKGKRFPRESLVQKLAEIRKESPHKLLALLWRDRMLYAFSRELSKVIKKERPIEEGIEAADLALVISKSIAALPNSGKWIEKKKWIQSIRADLGEQMGKRFEKVFQEALGILQQKNLAEIRADKVRRQGRYYMPQNPAEQHSLAMQFCTIFIKGLLDKLVVQEKDTYLCNHYLQIPKKDIAEFHSKLHHTVRRLVEEYPREEGELEFLDILISSVPLK